MTEANLSGRGDAPVENLPLDWSELLARHEHWLRTVVLARLGEPAAVEEVMQEVALAAVRQQAPIADPAKVGPWLYQIAVRQTLLYRRKAGRRRKLTQGYAESFRPSGEDHRTVDPLGWLLADERRRLVREALGSLTSRDREILLLKYTENWSYRQIAEHLGLSHSAVEARLHRARSRMRKELAAREVALVSK